MVMTATYRSTAMTARDRNSNPAEAGVSDTVSAEHIIVEQQSCGMVRSGSQPTKGPAMPRDTAERTRLADEMDRRRIALSLRWEHIAEKARISTTHLRKFRRGDAGASDVVLAALEDALQWERGSIAAILDGGQPTPAAESSHRDPTKTLAEMLLERGLARPEELSVSDEIRNDPVAWEILEAEDLSPAGRDRMLAAYAHMRREVFEAVRQQKGPRG